MKNVRIRVRESCSGSYFDYAIYDGKKPLFIHGGLYDYKGIAIRYAKAMAKRIGIPYDSEIVKQRGC